LSATANEWARLEVAEYIDDTPSAEDLKGKYRLDPPQQTIRLGFTGADAAERTVQIGAARPNSPEVFARLNNQGGVFSLTTARLTEIDRGPRNYLPLNLWTVGTDRIVSLEIRRGPDAANESYSLTREAGSWRLSGKFDAMAGSLASLLAGVATITAEQVEALTVPDPARYGFQTPSLRLTVTSDETGSLTRRTLVVGGVVPGTTNRYARLEGPIPVVYQLPVSILAEIDQPALARLDTQLLNLDSNKLTSVELKPENGPALTLTRSPRGGWSAGERFPLDQAAAENLVQVAAKPPIPRLADYGSGVSLPEYGLDRPALTITLRSVNGTHTIAIGKANTAGDRYLRIDQGSAVALLPQETAERLLRDRLGLVDRSLLTLDPNGITGGIRTQGTESLEVRRTTSGWELRQPTVQKADTLALDELVDQLARLRATRVVALDPTEADRNRFGFGSSASNWVWKSDGGSERRILIGGPLDPKAPNGERYVMVPPVATDATAPVVVGVLAAPLAGRLLATPLGFRDRTLARFPDADRLTVARGDRTATFQRQGGTWRMTAPVAAEAEQGELDELLNSLSQLRADELITEKATDLKPFGLDPPELALALSNGEQPVLTLLLGNGEKSGNRITAKTSASDLIGWLDAGLSARVRSEFRRRAIWTDLDASQAEAFSITPRGGPNGAFRKGNGGWSDAIKPVESVDQSKVTEMVAALANLRAERYVVDGPNAKPELYGLATPAQVLVLSVRGNPPRTLHLGGFVANSNKKQVYARVMDPERPEIFVLSEADTAKLMQTRPMLTAPK
jgi:hypothetical protein